MASSASFSKPSPAPQPTSTQSQTQEPAAAALTSSSPSPSPSAAATAQPPSLGNVAVGGGGGASSRLVSSSRDTSSSSSSSSSSRRSCEIELVYSTRKMYTHDRFNATMRLVNNREEELNSWQVVWRFASSEGIVQNTTKGGLLFDQGTSGRNGPPSRVVNYNDWQQNGVILAEGGFREFTFVGALNEATTSDVPSREFRWSRRVKDVSVNGLECSLIAPSSSRTSSSSYQRMYANDNAADAAADDDADEPYFTYRRTTTQYNTAMARMWSSPEPDDDDEKEEPDGRLFKKRLPVDDEVVVSDAVLRCPPAVERLSAPWNEAAERIIQEGNDERVVACQVRYCCGTPTSSSSSSATSTTNNNNNNNDNMSSSSPSSSSSSSPASTSQGDTRSPSFQRPKWLSSVTLNRVVYDDGVASGWNDCSWGGTYDVEFKEGPRIARNVNETVVYAEVSDSGGWCVETASAFGPQLDNSDALEFDIIGSLGGEDVAALRLELWSWDRPFDNSTATFTNQSSSSSSDYPSYSEPLYSLTTLEESTWTRVQVPLLASQAPPGGWNRIVLRAPRRLDVEPKFLLSDVALFSRQDKTTMSSSSSSGVDSSAAAESPASSSSSPSSSLASLSLPSSTASPEAGAAANSSSSSSSSSSSTVADIGIDLNLDYADVDAIANSFDDGNNEDDSRSGGGSGSNNRNNMNGEAAALSSPLANGSSNFLGPEMEDVDENTIIDDDGGDDVSSGDQDIGLTLRKPNGEVLAVVAARRLGDDDAASPARTGLPVPPPPSSTPPPQLSSSSSPNDNASAADASAFAKASSITSRVSASASPVVVASIAASAAFAVVLVIVLVYAVLRRNAWLRREEDDDDADNDGAKKAANKIGGPWGSPPPPPRRSSSHSSSTVTRRGSMEEDARRPRALPPSPMLDVAMTAAIYDDAQYAASLVQKKEMSSPGRGSRMGFLEESSMIHVRKSSVQSADGTLVIPSSPKRPSNGINGSCAGNGKEPSSREFTEICYESDIDLGILIGSGAFGSVYRATWRKKDAKRSVIVAVKMLHISHATARDLAAFRSEVALLSRLHHPNIVRFYGACPAPPNVCLVVELAEGGSLHNLIHGVDDEAPGVGALPYAQLIRIATDVAEAMAYLHPDVVHRDLKTQNVLLDGMGRAKVCDFGIAKFKERTFLSTKNVQAGTPNYMAPEIFGNESVSEACDVFSFAVLLWEMLTGLQPWGEATNPMQVIYAVGVQQRRLPLPTDGGSAALKLLIERCWAQEPEDRPLFESDILNALYRMRRGEFDSSNGNTARSLPRASVDAPLQQYDDGQTSRKLSSSLKRLSV